MEHTCSPALEGLAGTYLGKCHAKSTQSAGR
jgi:hypothetical protein